MTNADRPFDQLCRLYDLAQRDLRRTVKANRAIEIAILVLSIITAGALWTLVAEYVPAFAKWVGAIAATVVAILTGYQTSLGPKKRLELLLPKFKGLAEAIGKFRDGEPIGWKDYKDYLTEMEVLGVQVPIGPPRKSAEELAKMSAEERARYLQMLEQSYPQ